MYSQPSLVCIGQTNKVDNDKGLKYHVKLFSIMLSVSCRDVGVDCDFKGTGETEEELMNNCVEHAINDHGWTREDVMKHDMQEKIKAHIQKS